MARQILRLAATALAAAAFAVSASAQSLIRDAEIEETLREWTDPILTVAGLNPQDVGFYIINDSSLNAFVANGQNIHIHTGLIIAADSPDEIKGVIAHETCHIACGHSVGDVEPAIEAIEFAGEATIGVQWHPEMLSGPDPVHAWLIGRATERALDR